MHFGRREFSLLVVAISLGLTACGGEDGVPAETERYVRIVGDTSSQTEDAMPPIHKRAIELVEREAALAALRGDGRLAVRIGFEFAHANHFEEAGYWYLIAAENGSGVGMQHVALSVAEYDCRRAIYWLRKAIDSGDLRGQAQEANKKTLSSWEASCGE